MKRYNLLKSCVASMLMTLITVVSWAQEKSVDINVTTTKTTTTWYAQPWVWVVGAAVFILLLVALVRGGNSAKE